MHLELEDWLVPGSFEFGKGDSWTGSGEADADCGLRILRCAFELDENHSERITSDDCLNDA